MNRSSIVIAVIAVIALAGGSGSLGAAEERLAFRIQAQIFVQQTSAGQAFEVYTSSSEYQPGAADRGGGVAFHTDVSRVQLGAIDLELGAQPLWNGHPEPPPDAGIEILTSPLLSVQEGQAAVVRSTMALEYLEPLADGHYAVRRTSSDDSPAVRMELVVNRNSSSDGLVDVDFSLEVRQLSGRMPVSGTELDVGKPVILRREVATQFVMSVDTWQLITVHELVGAAGTSSDLLLTLLRVTPGY